MLIRSALAFCLVGLLPTICAAQAAAPATPAIQLRAVRVRSGVAAPVSVPYTYTVVTEAAVAEPALSTPGAPVATSSAEDPAAKERKQKRLEKIQQLQFDRRPSTILKTWLEPAPTPPKKAEPPATKPAEATAPATETPTAPGEAASVSEAAPATTTEAAAAEPVTTEHAAAEAAPAEPAANETAPAEAPAAEATSSEPVAETTTEAAATPVDAPATEPIETTAAPADGAAAPGEAAAIEPTADDKAVSETAAAEKEAAEKAAAEAKAAEAKAAEEKAKAEETARLAAEAEAQFDYELKVFVRNVTLGQWGEVKAYLATLDKEEGKALYDRLVAALQAGPMPGGFDMNAIQQMIANAAAPAEFQKFLAQAGQTPNMQFNERNQFTMKDLHGLIVASPGEASDQSLTMIGVILRQAIVDGNDLEALLADLHVQPDSKEPPLLSKRQTAKLLFAAVEPVRAGQFLPTVEEAAQEQDAPGLNLLARHYLAMHQKEKKDSYLEDAWRATQAALAVPVPEGSEEIAAVDAPPAPQEEFPAPEAAEVMFEDADPFGCTQVTDVSVDVAAPAPAETAPVAEAPAAAATTEKTAEEKEAEKKRIAELKQAKLEAMQRAVELAPQVRKELGQKWLDESFTDGNERGREILAAIGSMASTNTMSRPNEADFRRKTLQLQSAAVESLLRAAPDKAQEWSDTLTMLAAAWLREAQISLDMDQSDSERPGYRRDRFGNYYYVDEQMSPNMMRYNNGMIQPIRMTDIMESRPSDAWLAVVQPDLAPKFAEIFAQLHLKLGEDAAAFPFIERLAATHPERAKTLAEQFLQVWTTNHNPNQGRQGYDPYFYIYGYERRAERIPLTRSKQERNLKELADLVKRLRALPIKELNERLITQAFTTAHSHAEVYKLESIETVFGSMEYLKPRTLADLIQQMRGNLAGLWRSPAVQEQSGTKRKQKDIQLEVEKGYQVARAVVAKGLEKYPNHWALVQADAALMYDENDFKNELQASSTFSENRAKAFARFQEAANLYAAAAGDLRKDEQTTEVFEQWYYASLGAVDLASVTPDKVPDLRQPARIHEALNALPAQTLDSHMERFANNLFSRVSSARPELKFRYLRTGFEIVGDHKMAREARKLLDYYNDLVTEIKLEAKVDGSDVVGSGKPFGVFVNIVHTKEIERESGGFGRYLQNQNTNQSYYYNFGRPLENYRDKFQDIVGQALGEQFDVISVTFQEDTVTSKALPEYGWRVTPYAYLLLKARGPQVDKINPVRLDFDFLDTSGYAILPVETAPVPVDASTKDVPPRPAGEVTITQTLDERQADEGKLVLEIRAAARGLVPELTELVDFKPEGFEVSEMDDGGPAVTKFDNDADTTAVLSERIWTIALKPAGDAKTRPAKFAFATAKVPVKEIIYQRYEDADLVPVEKEFALQQKYAGTSYAGIWVPILGVCAAALVALFGVFVKKQPEEAVRHRFEMPAEVTPFTVIGLLRDIQANNGLDPNAKSSLQDTIVQLERHYFLHPAPVEPDLPRIAERWLAETSHGSHAPQNGRG